MRQPYTIPDAKRQLAQPNSGDSQGNLFASYNLDLETNKGRFRISPGVRKIFNTTDHSDFSGYAAKILNFGGESGSLFAISDNVYKTSASTPTTGWTEITDSGAPDSGHTIMDAVVFNSLLLISTSTNIIAWDGSSWSDWWTDTLGQNQLTTGQRHLLRVGSSGTLYIVDKGNLVYSVTTDSSVTLTGDGTLDLSATPHLFQCMETTSTRLFLGTTNFGGEAVIAEWDMGEQTNSPNRLHKMGAEAVWCIAIWNDTPIAVLSNGKVKQFNGTAFVDIPGIQFPVGDKLLSHDSIHSNGWAIIDDLPHFLMSGSSKTADGGFDDDVANSWYFPSGIWCLDPDIGLYHRFAVGTGESTQSDYGQPSLATVGALYALSDTDTKFLASYECYTSGTTSTAMLAYNDLGKSKPTRGFFVTSFVDDFNDPWKTVRLIHRRLGSGDSIKVYYREHDVDTSVLSGTFLDTTHFNTTDDASGVVGNSVAFIKTGTNAGAIVRISDISSSKNTYSLQFAEPLQLATGGESVTLEAVNFRYLMTIDGQADWKETTIPNSETARHLQVFVEVYQAAGNKQELDYVIIS